MIRARQWRTHHKVWAVFNPEFGIRLYASRREAKRASEPGEIVRSLHVMQEVDQNWQPKFPTEHVTQAADDDLPRCGYCGDGDNLPGCATHGNLDLRS